jgi:hypothetical protein
VVVIKVNKPLEEIFFLLTMSIFTFMVVIFPNSNRYITIPLIFVLALAAAFRVKLVDSNIVAIWYLSCLVTIFYLFVGVESGYPEAIPEVVFVYMISPALWLLLINALCQYLTCDKIAQLLTCLGVVGALTVFMFYFLFFSYGAESVGWLGSPESANITIIDGRATATMHVFGSLLFICGGYFAAPQIIRNFVFNLVIAFSLVAATLLSGRSALFVSELIGASIFLVARLRHPLSDTSVRSIAFGVVAALAVGLALPLVAGWLDVDIKQQINASFEKIGAGGGEERRQQTDALIAGIMEHWFLGAGHGVGVSVLRNEGHPWRYEILWLAILFRVGILGAAVYLIPMFIIVSGYFKEFLLGRNSKTSDFMFGGFLAGFVGTATNPYLESFEFQWMYVLPFIYFYSRGRVGR